MKISIVTICYNNLEGLKRTVKSVLQQTRFDCVEYIIIDGDSIDGTYQFLSTLPENVKWISEKDAGISDAFNKGLKFVSGEAVLFLNSGDYFITNNVIEKVINDWNKFKVDIISYKVNVLKGLFIPALKNEQAIYESCTEPHQGTFVAKRIYDIIGGYSHEYKIRMDFHFFAKCRKSGFSFKFINEVIVKYEEGGTSMKRENRMRFWEEGMAIKFLYGIRVGIKDILKCVLYRNPLL